MSHPAPQQTDPAVRRIITEQVCKVIRQRVTPGRPLAVDLLKGLAVYRFTGPPAAEPPRITPAHLTCSRSFRKVTTLAQLLRGPVGATLRLAGLLGRSGAAIPYLAISACGPAGRLMEQLGLRDPAILNYSRRPPELKRLLRESLSTAAEAESLANACVVRIVAGLGKRLTSRAGRRDGTLSALRFRAQGPAVRVEGLTQDGDLAASLPLHDFVVSFVAPAVESTAEEMDRGRPAWESHRDRGMAILRDVCPGLAHAAQLALEENQPIGVRLCAGRTSRGLPLDVWFHVDPRGSTPQPACMLSVNRPHRDFILEAADGSRYYFPPCLLSARLSFADLAPHAQYPIVRQPAGGYNWCHPYTGKLGPGLFAGARLLHDEDAILYAPCEQAVALFPQLQQRTQTPMESTLCLGGQSHTVLSVQEKLCSALSSAREPDVLAAVTALHDIARLGLTRGHQDNRSSPRARLRPDSMPYPLQRRRVSGALAKRTFVFVASGTTRFGVGPRPTADRTGVPAAHEAFLLAQRRARRLAAAREASRRVP